MTPFGVDRILLVDDDRVTNLMHTRMIRQAGLAGAIDVATDGEAAIDYLTDRLAAKAPFPELILLDLNMPRMNGFEFLDAYDSLPDAVKQRQEIVMLSTSILAEDHKRAESDPNVRLFITKPIRKEGLKEIVTGCHQRLAACASRVTGVSPNMS